MTPILYGKSETAFTSNGKGRLVDCISCTVTEERNGIYECEFEYPITGKFYEEMTVNGGVISVTHDDNGDRQAFDIYKYSAPINGIVTFNACHISYRLNGITVNPFTASSCSAALTAIGTNSMQTNPFTFWTDKSVSSTYTLANPASARGLLWGSEGSILDVYGKGEYEFDMFTVKLHTNRGSNSGVTVRYSKNLSSITKTYDESGVYNAVAPYWKGTDGTVVMLSEGYVYNSLPVIRCVPLDLSSEFSDAPTQAELRTRANAYLAANEPWTADENITFDFVPLWQTDEYRSVAVLQKVKLCDTISVYYPKLGVTKVNAKIIKVVYDVLREKYASMEVGTAKQTLESTMLAPVETDISNINSDLSGKIISYINQTPEQITIQANKVNLTGYATFTNLSTPGQTVIDGGNITSNSISVSQFTSTAQGALAANATTKMQYYLSTSSSSATGGTWSDTVPTWASGKYVWTREATTVTLASGSTTTNYSTAVYDKNLTTALSTATSASSAASAAQTTANGANAGEHLVYISKPSGTITVSAPSAWVTDATGSQNTWTIKRPEYNSSYPVLFVATQRITVGGTVTCTTPLVDQTTTVIDGGHITTGTIDAGVVNVTNINASNITTGTMSANKISGGTLTLGGLNNTNGTLVIKDASNNTTGTIDNTGATINGNFVSKGETDQNHYPTTQSIANGEMESSVTVGGVDYTLFQNAIAESDGDCSASMYLGTVSGGKHSAINPFFITLFGTDYDLMLDKNGAKYEILSGGVYDSTAWQLSRDGAGFDIPVSVYKGLSVTGATSLNGDATVGGVLDVTNRRAADKLSSAGWHRVLTYEGANSGQPNGSTGALIRFNVVVWGNTSVNGNHQIDLSTAYGTGHREFVNEFSNGQDTLIDKIRYTTDGNYFHVDVHFTGNSDNLVIVYFDPYIYTGYQDNITSEGLEPVADAPDGETVVTTYTFSQTGAHFGNVFSNGIQLFGLLSGGTAITSNANLNNYTDPGVYTCTPTVAATLTNSAFTTVGFKMLVMDNVTGTTARWQICLASYDNCIVAIRWRNGNGVWQAWKRITPA